MPDLICQRCNKAFRNKEKTQKYCGVQCANEAKKNRVTITCRRCGKVKEVRASSQAAQYCSFRCRSIGNKARTGKRPTNAFSPEQMSGEKNPLWKGGSIAVPCDYCKKTLQRARWEIERSTRIFCDSTCFGQWKSENWTGENSPGWRGGHKHYYGSNWVRQKRIARARDNHTCQVCGVTEKDIGRALEVHHIIRFADFVDYRDANQLKNLICLCRSCHMDVEYGKTDLPQVD